MKKYLAALLAFCVLAAAAMAIGAGLSSSLNTPTVPGQIKILSDGTISDLSSATALPSIPSNARTVWIQAQAGNIRFRIGDTDPTPASGGIIYEGGWYNHTGSPISDLKLIEEAGADAYYFYTN